MADYKHIIVNEQEGFTVVSFTSKRLASDYPNEELGEEMFSLLEVGIEKKIILDLGNVQYMCSSALSRFVLMQTKTSDNGSKLRLSGISPILNQIFSASGLYRIMDIRETLEDAKQAF